MVRLRAPVQPRLLQPLEVVLILDLGIFRLLHHLKEEILLVHVDGNQGLVLGAFQLREVVLQADLDELREQLLELSVRRGHDRLVLLPRQGGQGMLEVRGPNQLNAQQSHLRDVLIGEDMDRQAPTHAAALRRRVPTLPAHAALHLCLEVLEPFLDVPLRHDRGLQHDLLFRIARHAFDLLDLPAVELIKRYTADGVEQLLEIILDRLRVAAALGEDLQEDWVGGEEEAGELLALALEVALQRLLACLQAR
mmetsp:Transcript_62936/g.150320  ORF Transcript_62936/g.150320 Transcript_62936/m.150320 type:complete len:251 (+) Transcript_62936:728-1480(+)